MSAGKTALTVYNFACSGCQEMSRLFVDFGPRPRTDDDACCRGGKTIVFFSTKHSAHRAKILFGLAELPPSAELHGNMTQAARLESLERFRKVQIWSLP